MNMLKTPWFVDKGTGFRIRLIAPNLIDHLKDARFVWCAKLLTLILFYFCSCASPGQSRLSVLN